MSFPIPSPDGGPEGHWGQSSSGLTVNTADSSSSEDSPQSETQCFPSHSPTGLSPTGNPFLPNHETQPAPKSLRIPRPARTPSRYDWSKHKPTIKRLYMDEDKTLREMMDIMEREHNFVATGRMVKTRLKKWGYSKNVSIRSEEVEPLMEMIFEAESQGDVRKTSTEVTLATGRVVGLDRVAAHLRRKRVPTNVIHKASQLSLARYRQGGRSPSPTTLFMSTPDVFRIPEGVFADVHNYVYGQLTNLSDINLVKISSTEDKLVFDLIFAVRNFFVQGKVTEALALLRAAPKRLKLLLDTDLPTIPRCIFLVLIHLLSAPGSEQLKETIKALVRYTAAVVSDPSSQWSPSHPLRRMLVGLSRLEEDSLREVAINGYKRYLSSYESYPDQPSVQDSTVGAWLDLGETAGFENLPFANLEASLLKGYQDTLSQSGDNRDKIIRQLFWMAELERQRVKACGVSTRKLKQLYATTLQTCEGASPRSWNAELNCHYYLAGIHKTEGNRALAEHHMRLSIDACIDSQDYAASAARLMGELEGWLNEWGEDHKVEEMQGELVNQMNNLGLESSDIT